MAKTATLTVQYALAGDGYNQSSTGPTSVSTQTNTAATVPTSLVAAGAGFNQVAVPATATGVVIRPPPGNTVSVTMKGITGDTGWVLGAITSDVAIPFAAASMANLGITVGGAVTLAIEWC